VTREPAPLPTLVLPEEIDLFDLDESAIKLEGYKPHPAISAPIAV
jgi:thymidylate synthase